MRPSKPASVLLSLVLALLVLSFSISVPILFRPFYYVQIDALHLQEQTGWSAEVIREAYDEVSWPGRSRAAATSPMCGGSFSWILPCWG